MRVFPFNMNIYAYCFLAYCFHSTAKNKYLIKKRKQWYPIFEKELRRKDLAVGEEGLLLLQHQRQEEAPESELCGLSPLVTVVTPRSPSSCRF